MATQEGTNEVENETQQSAMPTENQQTTDTVQPTEAVETQTSEVKDESGLPSEASERTRREFEKLQGQLREERTRKEYYESVFNSMNAPKVELPTVYDPETGLVNERVFTDVQRQVAEANARATRAETMASSYVAQQEERDAYSSHPELSDKSFFAQTRGIMYDSQVNPQEYGKQFTLKEAADYLKNTTKPSDKAKAQAQKEVLEQIATKDQATLEAAGTGGRTSTSEGDEEQLRYDSRRGNVDALAARLSKIPR